MSSKKVENTEEIKEEVVEQEVVQDECEEIEVSKFAKIKRHGKKIAIGVGLAAAGIIGFALGRNGSCDCEEISDSTEDVVDPE